MHELLNSLKEWWGLVASVLGIAAWGVRLEQRAKANSRDIQQTDTEMQKMEARLKEQRAEDLERQARDRGEILSALTRVEEKLDRIAAK